MNFKLNVVCLGCAGDSGFGLGWTKLELHSSYHSGGIRLGLRWQLVAGQSELESGAGEGEVVELSSGTFCDFKDH